MTVDSGVVVSAGVDWITVTTATVNQGALLSSWASEMCTVEMRKGFNRKPWGLAGFDGHSVGMVQVGRRNDECIVRLTSDVARESWRRAYQLGEGVTRLDVQFTHRTNVGPRERIHKHKREAERYSASRKRGPYVGLVTGNDGSDTLYLGKRESNVFGRIYNKGVQSGFEHYAGCVRYEVQFNKRLACVAARSIASAKDNCGWSISQAHAFSVKRGCALPAISTLPVQLIPSRISTDLSRKLKWLANAVRPSVHDILESVGQDELLRAFQLQIISGELRVVLDQPLENDSLN